MKKLLLIFFILCGCSSNPVLYPNQKYKKVGKEKAKRDIQVCKDESEEFLESSKGKQILKGAARGGIFGTIMGGVTGLITGDVGKGLAQGAVIGGAAGATAEAISPDELRRAYVNTCLRDKGYRVLGWD